MVDAVFYLTAELQQSPALLEQIHEIVMIA